MGLKRPLQQPPTRSPSHNTSLISLLTAVMLFYASSVLAFVVAVVAQGSTINTPASVVQCQPVQVSWTSANTPVFISIIPGGQAGAAALQDFGQQTGTSLTWTANIAAGTSITFQLRDSTGAVAFSSRTRAASVRDSSGAVAYSAPATVQSSSDSSCLGAGASTSAVASSSAAGTTPVTSSAAPATTAQATSSEAASISSVSSSAASSVSSVVSSATAPATTSRASSAASVISSATSRAGTASSAAASPTSTNGAMPAAKVGLAGLLGLAAAVVMA
ncbi:unnamed protein product [Rhizoctonia solani]|uniref:Uncharacterized protein n=1 Tax=Rhizoctonia solani TaxID=456999 RepID=A0A8H3D194_9AGAM|nr:unnamed protein product [Rhizoctonia solani]